MAPRGDEREDEGPEKPEESGKPSIRYWLSALDAAEEAAQPSRKQAKRAWREYARGEKKGDEEIKVDTETRWPVYWSAIRTMMPAIYSRTPVPVAKRTLDDLEDNIARLASLASVRLAKYHIRRNPFDRVQYVTRDNFLHAGKTTNRIVFESEISAKPKKIYVQQVQQPPAPAPMMMQPGAPMPQMQIVWVMPDGQPVPPERELLEDEQGVYVEETEEEITRVKCSLVPVHYYDILHTPNARHWEEVRMLAFRTPMTRHDIEKRFGKEWLTKLSFSPLSHAEKDQRKEGKKHVGTDDYADVWEIWDAENKRVMWLDRTHNDEFLDIQDDPYELDGFFPCPPFMLGTQGDEDMYCVPDFVQLEPLINQIHAAAKRFRGVMRATKRKGLFDASVPDLDSLANNTDERDFIGIANFQELIGEGGLEKIIKFFPVGEFVEAAQELAQALQLLEQKFYELYGIPDILRGVTDPKETAAAQQQKGRFTSLFFSAIQREFQRLVRDDIELMCDLSLKKFPESKLRSIMGADRWKPEDQPLWPQVLALLQDDDERAIRIEIETDSTITMNQNEDIEQRNYLAKTVFEGLAAVATAGQQSPQFQSAAMHLLIYVVRGLRYGDQVEQEIKQIAERLQQEAQNPQARPDPEQIKAQALQQKMMLEAQLQQQKAQMDMALEQEKARGRMQVEMIQARADIDTTYAKIEAEIRRDDRKAENAIAIQQMLAEIEAGKQQAQARLDAVTKLFEAELKRTDEKVSSIEKQGQQPINVAIQMPKPSRKRVVSSTGPNGERVHELEEIDDVG